jgi:hypothetical protein
MSTTLLSLVAAVANLHGRHLAIEDAGPGCRVTLWRNHNDATYISAAGRPAIAAAG